MPRARLGVGPEAPVLEGVEDKGLDAIPASERIGIEVIVECPHTGAEKIETADHARILEYEAGFHLGVICCDCVSVLALSVAVDERCVPAYEPAVDLRAAHIHNA